MQRIATLLHVARSTAACQGDFSSALANRLLSNSQATTSANYPQVRSAATASETSNRNQRAPSQPNDPRRDRGGGQDTPSSNAPPRRTEQEAAEAELLEPEIGFVQDGPYPYSATEELEVVNLAGSTETAWEFLGSNDEECITWFGVDFTRGKVPEVERNALLSDSTKEMMYQMHSHNKAKYSVEYLAKLFAIRHQRVMAILTLKGMEHETIPLPDSIHSSKKTPKSKSPDTADADQQATASLAADSEPDSTAATDSEPVDSRAQIVKASMDEAAKDVPAYLESIKQEADSWQLESNAAETPAERKTNSNILTSWLRHLAKDPFWIRPTKDETKAAAKAAKDAAAAYAAAADADYAAADAKEPLSEKEQKAADKAQQELEQQQLQDEVQAEQRDRSPAEDPAETSDPKTEGVERYMLSNPDFLPYIMENEVWDCHEFTGTGERHTKFIPRYPKFEYFTDDRPEALAADKEAGGKANIERPVLDAWEQACNQLAAEEEVHLVKEFKERLQYNLQQTGANLDRNSRFKNAPRRPKEGWSMVVQDVSKPHNKKQYVAMPGGKTRSLTADEQVYLDRMVPKKRKKIV